jgi:hypothetical protein
MPFIRVTSFPQSKEARSEIAGGTLVADKK